MAAKQSGGGKQFLNLTL